MEPVLNGSPGGLHPWMGQQSIPQTCQALSHPPSTAPLQLHTPCSHRSEHPHAPLLAKPQPREKYSTFQVKILKSSSQVGSPDGFLCILKAQPAPVPGLTRERQN